jgi:hypothetical protein
MSEVLINLQENSTMSKSNYDVEIRALERRLEENVHISNSYYTSLNNKYTEVQESIKYIDDKQYKRINDVTTALYEKMAEYSNNANTDRVNIEKRIVLLEKAMDSIMERIDLSKSALEGLLLTSPEIKSLQNTAIKFEGLSVEFTSLRKSVRNIDEDIVALKGHCVKSSELIEVKERIYYLEPLQKKVSRYVFMYIIICVYILQCSVVCTMSIYVFNLCYL